VSARPKTDRPLSQPQFVALVVVVALSGVQALINHAGVAGPHGKCPGETQVSRPGAAACWGAYKNTPTTGIVGHPAATG
jgi:hypothetical protein